MGLLDLALAPIRAVVSAGERDVTHEIREVEHVEHGVLDTAGSIRDATESIEKHIAVLDTLASSIGPLTESVNRLTAQMAELNQVLSPMAGAEREISALEHVFGRHRHEPGSSPSGSPPDATAPPG